MTKEASAFANLPIVDRAFGDFGPWAAAAIKEMARSKSTGTMSLTCNRLTASSVGTIETSCRSLSWLLGVLSEIIDHLTPTRNAYEDCTGCTNSCNERVTKARSFTFSQMRAFFLRRGSMFSTCLTFGLCSFPSIDWFMVLSVRSGNLSIVGMGNGKGLSGSSMGSLHVVSGLRYGAGRREGRQITFLAGLLVLPCCSFVEELFLFPTAWLMLRRIWERSCGFEDGENRTLLSGNLAYCWFFSKPVYVPWWAFSALFSAVSKTVDSEAVTERKDGFRGFGGFHVFGTLSRLWLPYLEPLPFNRLLFKSPSGATWLLFSWRSSNLEGWFVGLLTGNDVVRGLWRSFWE